MKKSIMYSMIAVSSLFASDTNLGNIDVNSTKAITTLSANNVSTSEVKNADLAEVLSKESSSINMIRRNGIANDITIRGMKRDNINVLIDDGKIYGACPNRMDPPSSHILVNNIESVEVIEGPYDVENFGSLGSVVKINTLEPKAGFNGEIDLNAGSFGYKKSAATISGGTDKIKALLSMSYETSDQYKDGDGKTLAEQTEEKAPYANQYQDRYKDMEAYTKKTALAKLYFNLTDNQDVRVSYTANRSDDVMYASSSMDALRDDSDLFNVKYRALELGKLSKEFNIDYYYSKVEHPMSTYYRNSAVSSTMMGQLIGEMVSTYESEIYGIKLKNTMDLAGGDFVIGVDNSRRTWDGHYESNLASMTGVVLESQTLNNAVFSSYEKSYDQLLLHR